MLLFMHISSLLLLALVFIIVGAIRVTNTRLASRRSSCYQKCGQSSASLSWDIFGISNLIEMVRVVLDGAYIVYLEKLFDSYGDTHTVKILGNKITFTKNAAYIRQIMKDRFRDYDVARGIRTAMFEHYAPGTIGATDGSEWKENRIQWRHFVAHPNQILNLDFVEEEFQGLIRHITEGVPVDMHPISRGFTMDIIHGITLGESTNCLDPERQSLECKNYVETLVRAHSAIVRIGILGPIAKFIPQGGYRKDCATIKNYLGRKIQDRLVVEEQEGGRKDQASRQETFFDRLLHFTHDPVTLNHSVASMVMASEPNSAFLSNTVWLLSRHPTVYKKLRKSVLEMVGYQRPTYEQFTKFVYLKNVISESLRLLPPGPLNLRIANTDTRLYDGEKSEEQDLMIQKGQRFVISILGCHRDPANFGKDASSFRPERWEDEKTKSPAYIPFSVGPRVCSGQHLALNVTTYILVRLVQTYSHIVACDNAEFAAILDFSLCNGNGVWVTMIPDHQAPIDSA